MGQVKWKKRLLPLNQSIEAGDITQAQEQSQALNEQWDTLHRVLCLFLSHTTLEQIDQNLPALPQYLQQEESGLALAACARLLDQTDNLRDSEALLLENIL